MVQRQLDIVALLRRAVVTGARLTAAEAVDGLDFLAGLAAALPAQPHFCYVVHSCARELAARERMLAESEDHRPDTVIELADRSPAKSRKLHS